MKKSARKTEGKHTPTPWILAQESIDPNWHILTGPGGRVIANLHIEPENHVDRANAALLFASPGTLKALKRLASLADGRVNGDDNDEMCAWAEALHDANTAIREADGDTDNGGCDRCGINDREFGSHFCEGCAGRGE